MHHGRPDAHEVAGHGDDGGSVDPLYPTAQGAQGFGHRQLEIPDERHAT